jgi:hypothetical protein
MAQIVPALLLNDYGLGRIVFSSTKTSHHEKQLKIAAFRHILKLKRLDFTEKLVTVRPHVVIHQKAGNFVINAV